MDDLRISRLLGELPRHDASPYFTAGVLRRIRQRQSARSKGRWHLAFASSFVVLLLLSGLGLLNIRQHHRQREERQEAMARLESFEARKQVLEDEIRTLQRLARDAQPVIYLGSTSNLDVVVDLRRLASQRPARGNLGFRPEPVSTQFVNHPRR